MQPPRGTADIEKHPFLVPMVLRPVRGTDFVSSSRIKSITARLPALKNAVEYIVKDLIYSQTVKFNNSSFEREESIVFFSSALRSATNP